MSVYTKVLPHELTGFLQAYSLGQLEQFAGISDGIENTNYFVTTDRGEYVLTLFEVLTRDELPYFLELMAFLAERGIPCAHPVADNRGNYLRDLNGKPAALVKKLTGASVDIPEADHCAAIGREMGRMHKVSTQFPLHRKMVRGPKWWKVTAERVLPKIPEAEARLLREELEFQFAHLYRNLPVGVIHADLFRDNALFIGTRLTGIIDFYYACNNFFIYDLAVTINDWCNSADEQQNLRNARALLGAYQVERRVSAGEIDAWPVMLRAAALRFWLSRLLDKYFPRHGEITHIKDPDAFRCILQNRVQNSGQTRLMWEAP